MDHLDEGEHQAINVHQNISGEPKIKLDLENVEKFVIKTD